MNGSIASPPSPRIATRCGAPKPAYWASGPALLCALQPTASSRHSSAAVFISVLRWIPDQADDQHAAVSDGPEHEQHDGSKIECHALHDVARVARRAASRNDERQRDERGDAKRNQ